jgi:hypothetical protein
VILNLEGQKRKPAYLQFGAAKFAFICGGVLYDLQAATWLAQRIM